MKKICAKTKNAFTLIEITLALGVVGVGVVSIMALFPAASNASRDAIGYTHAAESADNFLQLLKNKSMRNWVALIGDASGSGGLIPSSVPDSDRDNRTPMYGEGITASGGGQAMSRGTVFEMGDPGVFQVVSYRDGDDNNELNNNDEDVVDFRGIVAVWQEKSPLLDAGHRNIGVLLKAEVSWPIQRPYAAREKELYVLELFNR